VRLKKTLNTETETMNDSITPADRPNKTWSLKNLENYALDRASEINNFGRKTIMETWLFGESLSLIRDIKKDTGDWINWIKTQPYSLSTATNAIKVNKRVTFDELNLFKDMTVTDMKSALLIIQSPPPQSRRRERLLPINSEEAKVETTDGAPEKAAPRKITVTDYSRVGVQKNHTPEVGASLTASEVLGQAYTLLIEAEGIGVTVDCNEILAQISSKITNLLQQINVVVLA
jgi:hypothetical protein